METTMLGKEAVVGLSAGLSNAAVNYERRVLTGGDALQIKACVIKQIFKQNNTLQTLAFSLSPSIYEAPFPEYRLSPVSCDQAAVVPLVAYAVQEK